MDVIMESVAETRDRLNRLGDRTDGPAGPNSKPASRRCHHGKLSRSCELCDRERKIESLDRLCRRQSTILTGVAIAVRGEPEDAFAWSHHDLAERTQAVVEELEMLRQERDVQARRVAAAEAVLDELEALRGERLTQAELIAAAEAALGELEALRQEQLAQAQRASPVAAYVQNGQAQLLVLADQLGRIKERYRSGGTARPVTRRFNNGHGVQP
jgi:hypothetical protein